MDPEGGSPEVILEGEVVTDRIRGEEIGNGASIWPGAVLRGDIGDIVVGHHSSIQDNSCMHTLHDEFDVYVGNY